MKIILAFALMILIVKANPFENAEAEEQEEDLFEPEEDRSIPRTSFTKFDKNNDGFISKSEFKKRIKIILRRLGVDYSNDEIMDAFNLIDSNGDGKITLVEFEADIPLPKRASGCCVIIIIIRR